MDYTDLPQSIHVGRNLRATNLNTSIVLAQANVLSRQATLHALEPEIHVWVSHREERAILVEKLTRGYLRCPRWRNGENGQTGLSY